MASFSAFLRRLRAAFGASHHERVSAPSLEAHPYRAPAAREAPSFRPPGERADSELAALIDAQYAPLTHPRGKVEALRLDPPGLLDGWQVIGARRWFWQYNCVCTIVFEHAGRRFAYAPERVGPPEREHLTRLPARAVAPPGEEVDLAPTLQAGLRRAADTGASQRLRDGLSLLHLLATFTGYGSAELDGPGVYVGDEATALLDARVGRGARADVREALARGNPLEGGAAERAVVLLARHQPIDGTAGGYHAEIALARLELGGERLSYEWEIVWAESEEGIPLS